MPVVSVVLPFFNEDRYLEEAVQSVRDQQLEDWELILVDDGSTNRSTHTASDLAANDERIRYVEHPGHQNRGRSASRNLGVSHATAPYVAFLDADDVSLPNKLAEQVELMETMPDVALVIGAISYWYSWDPTSTKADFVLRTGGMSERRLDPLEALLELYPLGPGDSGGVTGLVRRSAFDAVGGFEERFRGLYDDQALLVKLYLRYPIYISSRIWYRYRQHDTSCCAQTSRSEYLRLRADFLEWLESYIGPGGDPRVDAAFRRARRILKYRALAAPALELFDHLPDGFKRPLRVLAGRTDPSAPSRAVPARSPS